MLPKTHIILGLVFSLILFNLFPEIGLLGFFTIFIASFMIDIDHYIFFVWFKKNPSPKAAFLWFITKNKYYLSLPTIERKKAPTSPCILHGLEAIVILLALSLVNNFFFFILVGFLFHEILDFISITYYGFSYNHILSQTYNILNFRKGNYSD